MLSLFLTKKKKTSILRKVHIKRVFPISVPILKFIKKIPGGLMVVPMLVSCIINTLFPEFMQIGNPMTATFTKAGTMTVCGIILVTNGTQIKIRQLGLVAKRCGSMMLLKIAMTFVLGYGYYYFFGLEGFAGIPLVAFIACILGTNPGVHLALMNSYGDKMDEAAFGPLNLLVAPAVPATVIMLCAGGSFDLSSVLATFIPFLFGIVLGNLDDSFTQMFSNANVILLPFIGICLGAGINLSAAVEAGIPGFILTVLYYVINFFPLVLFDRMVIKQRGHSGAALCAASGLSLTVPGLLATIDPKFAPFVDASVAQQALAVVITAFLTPYLTKFVVDYDTRRKAKKAAEGK